MVTAAAYLIDNTSSQFGKILMGISMYYLFTAFIGGIVERWKCCGMFWFVLLTAQFLFQLAIFIAMIGWKTDMLNHINDYDSSGKLWVPDRASKFIRDHYTLTAVLLGVGAGSIFFSLIGVAFRMRVPEQPRPLEFPYDDRRYSGSASFHEHPDSHLIQKA